MKHFLCIATFILLFSSSFFSSAKSSIYYKIENGMPTSYDKEYEVTYNSEDFQFIKESDIYGQKPSNLSLRIYPKDEEDTENITKSLNKFTFIGPNGKFSYLGHYKLANPLESASDDAIYGLAGYAGVGYGSVGTGCSGIRGEAEVYEAQYNSNNEVIALAADLYLRCKNAYNRVFIKIRYNSDIPLHLPDAYAQAGEDIVATGGDTVPLDGSLSYTDNHEIVSYHWTQIGGEPVEITNPKSVGASFTLPKNRENFDIYEFQLVITDDTGLSATDSVMVTSGIQKMDYKRTLYRIGRHFRWNELIINDSLPSEDLIIEKTHARGIALSSQGFDIVNFVGVNYDEFQDIRLGGYLYANDGGRGSHLPQMKHWQACNNATSSRIPDRNYFNVIDIKYKENKEIERLAIDYLDNCHIGATNPARGKIRYNSFAELISQRPYALAGPDQVIIANKKAYLQGAFSYSDDSFIKSYSWSQVSGPTMQLEDESSPVATVVKNPILISEVEAEFELTVVDNEGRTSKDRVKVRTEGLNAKSTHTFYSNTNFARYGINKVNSLISTYTLNNYLPYDGETIDIVNQGFTRANIILSAGEGNVLVEGEFSNIFDNSYTLEEMKFKKAFNNNTGCINFQLTTDLVIKEIIRNEEGKINSLALDFSSFCNFDGSSDYGSIRINSGVPIKTNVLNVDAGPDLIFNEGDDIDLTVNVEHDKPIMTEWTIVYGPALRNHSRTYSSTFEAIAPTIPTGESRHMVFRVRVWDGAWSYGEDYIAIKINDKSDELDFVDVTNVMDKPFYINTEPYQPFGIRVNDQHSRFLGLSYSPEQIESGQISPIIKSELDTGVHYQYLELFFKKELVTEAKLLIEMPSGEWDVRPIEGYKIKDLEQGWASFTISLPSNKTELTDDPKSTARFVVIGTVDSSEESNNTPVKETDNASKGGGTVPPLVLFIMMYVYHRRKA